LVDNTVRYVRKEKEKTAKTENMANLDRDAKRRTTQRLCCLVFLIIVIMYLVLEQCILILKTLIVTSYV